MAGPSHNLLQFRAGACAPVTDSYLVTLAGVTLSMVMPAVIFSLRIPRWGDD